jgi:hypothetical protein
MMNVCLRLDDVFQTADAKSRIPHRKDAFEQGRVRE